MIGASRAHSARAADVSWPRDPDAREGDTTLLRESVHDELQDRINGALARETQPEFLQGLEVHGVVVTPVGTARFYFVPMSIMRLHGS